MSAHRRIPPPPQPPTHGEARSQAAILIGIVIYAAGGALIVARSIVLGLGIDRSYWTGDFIIGITDLVLAPLRIVPGGNTELIGLLTLSDLTALVAVIAAPIAVLAFSNRR